MTAVNGIGESQASAPSAAVRVTGSFVVSTSPTVRGSATVGGTLTVDPGTWSPTPSGGAFQWFRNGAAIPGVDRDTYAPVNADLGRYLTVRVTGTGDGITKTRAFTAAVRVARS